MRTVGIDTNVLITFLLERQPGVTQTKKLFQDCLNHKVQIFVPSIVFPETEWVLRSYYKFARPKIADFIQTILEIDNVILADKSNMLEAIALYRDTNRLSLVDCLVLVSCRNYKVTMFLTFDQDLKNFYQDLHSHT